MTQTVMNGTLNITQGEWTLISEINCTFVVNEGMVDIIGMDGAAPGISDNGIIYREGQGEDASTDTLARFTGAGTADRIYARSLSSGFATLFISRAAVA